MPLLPTISIISAPADALFVERLARDLGGRGCRVLDIAQERLHEDPSTEPGELRRRLEQSAAVLVVLSPAAAQSEQVRGEVEFALMLEPGDHPRDVVPLLMTPTDVPHSLRGLHTIYFTAGPYEAALARLLAHLELVRAAAPAANLPAAAARGVLVADESPAGAGSAAAAGEPLTAATSSVALIPPAEYVPPTVHPAATQNAPASAPAVAAPAVAAPASTPTSAPEGTQTRRKRSLWQRLLGRG